VCSEVPEDSRVLRVRCLWFPTSDCLQSWLTRQHHEFTIVWRNLPPYDCFWYFVLSSPPKRAWQSGSKLDQRWYEGRLRQTMVDSWYCLDCIVPEEMSQVSGQMCILCQVSGQMCQMCILCTFWHYVYSTKFHPFEYRKKSSNDFSWRCPLYRSTIFSWVQLLSVSIFELPNKYPSFRLRHSANEKLFNVFVPHLSINSDSRYLY